MTRTATEVTASLGQCAKVLIGDSALRSGRGTRKDPRGGIVSVPSRRQSPALRPKTEELARANCAEPGGRARRRVRELGLWHRVTWPEPQVASPGAR